MPLILSYDRRGGAPFQRCAHVVVAIEPLTFDREEKLARTDGARVDRIPLCNLVTRKVALGRHELRDFRQRQFHTVITLLECPISRPSLAREAGDSDFRSWFVDCSLLNKVFPSSRRMFIQQSRISNYQFPAG